MNVIRWGLIGCGEVAEVKSGPGFQKARGSALVAVMRRDRARAEDFARRHGVPRAYDDADELIADREVDAVYVATPPSSHGDLAVRVAAAGKPCLVEKPMATSHAECAAMLEAFRASRTPLWVAYYRRALPRFLTARDLLRAGAIGRVASVRILVEEPLPAGISGQWRFDPAVAGAGLFFDLGSHCLDLIDFLIGPISAVSGYAINAAAAYRAEDVTVAAFLAGEGVAGTGTWNFTAAAKRDEILFTGSRGELRVPVFSDTDLVLVAAGTARAYPFRNPPHVHQPLIQTIVDELQGTGRCESTGETAARASWVMDRCLESYRRSSEMPAD